MENQISRWGKMMITKKIPVLIAAFIAVIALVGVTGTASAKGKDRQPIAFDTLVAVAGIHGVETNLRSGWTTIDREDLQGLGLINVTAGPAELGGLVLSGHQGTREQFTGPLPFASVVKGKAFGQFTLTNVFTGDVAVVGDYDLLHISSAPGCQIYAEGKWITKAKNSVIEGHGDISVCTNFVPGIGTFLTQVSVSGNAALVD